MDKVWRFSNKLSLGLKEDTTMGFFDQLGDVAKNLGAAAGDLAKQLAIRQMTL